MGEPVKKLGQAWNAQCHGQVAQRAGAKAQGLLLQAGVEARGQGDISHFNQDDRETAAQPGSRHCRQIHKRPGSHAEQSTLPVPITQGTCEFGLRNEERKARGSHAFMVQELL
jgi:hypothetical protein